MIQMDFRSRIKNPTPTPPKNLRLLATPTPCIAHPSIKNTKSVVWLTQNRKRRGIDENHHNITTVPVLRHSPRGASRLFLRQGKTNTTSPLKKKRAD